MWLFMSSSKLRSSFCVTLKVLLMLSGISSVLILRGGGRGAGGVGVDMP